MYEIDDLDVTPEVLLQNAVWDGMVKEREVAGLMNPDGTVNVGELIGTITDRDDVDWIGQFLKRGNADWYGDDRIW